MAEPTLETIFANPRKRRSGMMGSAIILMMDAKRAHDEAMDEYDSSTWPHHSKEYRDRLIAAVALCESELKRFVVAVIQEQGNV